MNSCQLSMFEVNSVICVTESIKLMIDAHDESHVYFMERLHRMCVSVGACLHLCLSDWWFLFAWSSLVIEWGAY